ncbi:hypothetical protein ACJX0J_008423, partial [Zea mays]
VGGVVASVVGVGVARAAHRVKVCRGREDAGRREKDTAAEGTAERKTARPMREKVSNSSSKPPVHMTGSGRPNAPPYRLPVLPMDDDEISSK